MHFVVNTLCNQFLKTHTIFHNHVCVERDKIWFLQKPDGKTEDVQIPYLHYKLQFQNETTFTVTTTLLLLVLFVVSNVVCEFDIRQFWLFLPIVDSWSVCVCFTQVLSMRIGMEVVCFSQENS